MRCWVVLGGWVVGVFRFRQRCSSSSSSSAQTRKNPSSRARARVRVRRSIAPSSLDEPTCNVLNPIIRHASCFLIARMHASVHRAGSSRLFSFLGGSFRNNPPSIDLRQPFSLSPPLSLSLTLPPAAAITTTRLVLTAGACGCLQAAGRGSNNDALFPPPSRRVCCNILALFVFVVALLLVDLLRL